jgi:ketosteroid isomerase-like protein
VSERLARVERLREAFGGAARRGGGERLIDVVEPLAGPELRSRLAGGAMTTDHIGIEGLRAGWEDFLRAFESVRVDFEEIVEVGDAVVDMVTLVGVPKGTELEVEQPAAAIWEFEDDRLVRVEFHLDRDEALRRAAG